MSRFQKSQGSHSPLHQQAVRAELARQVEVFLKQGGKIEQLSGPHFQPPRTVGVNVALITEVL